MGLDGLNTHPVVFRFMAHFSRSPYRLQMAAAEITRPTRPLLDLLRREVAEPLIQPLDMDLRFALFNEAAFMDLL